MPGSLDVSRATELAERAVVLVNQGQKEEGARALREAASLAPNSNLIKAVLYQIQDNESIDPLLKQCRKIAGGAKEAIPPTIQYLNRKDVQVPPNVGRECATLLLSLKGEVISSNTDFDDLVGLLLRQSSAARSVLAENLVGHTTKIFFQLWSVGKNTLDGFIQVLLDVSAWKSNAAREACEEDGFRLFLAKLIEAGQEQQSMAMRGIARLLAADAEKLQSVIDQDAFEALLSSLDERLPIDLRSQATLAIAKYMEVAQDTAQGFLTSFITFRVGKQTKSDLVVAFSVAASIFSIAPSIGATLFLTEGFVETLAPLARGTQSTQVEATTLSMMSAACIDQSCREAIRKHCTEWLKSVARAGSSERQQKAALILAKLQFANSDATSSETKSDSARTKEADELVNMFKGMMAMNGDPGKHSSIEGLAYASLQPKVKEELANDAQSLKQLIRMLQSSEAKSPLMFGGLSVLVNLTAYSPNLSEEQKRLTQLKAYANTSKAKIKSDPLNDDSHVTARCSAVLDAGILPLLVNISKSVSPTTLQLLLAILLSISRTPKHRGQLAQGGAVKLLLGVYTTSASNQFTPNPTQRIIAHALARILISVNPLLVFTSSSALPMTSAIRPLLLLLLDEETSEQRDLLPTFESLLALTNLASTPEDIVRTTIINLAWPRLEELLLAKNSMLQRASVELVCNLMASPQCVAKFADGSPQASNRLHILLALADVEDYATRRAAGGALAMLSEWDAAVEAVVGRERGVEILLGLCQEEQEEIVFRGMVCLHNLLSAPGDVGQKALEKVRREGGGVILKAVSKGLRNDQALEIGREILEKLGV